LLWRAGRRIVPLAAKQPEQPALIRREFPHETRQLPASRATRSKAINPAALTERSFRFTKKGSLMRLLSNCITVVVVAAVVAASALAGAEAVAAASGAESAPASAAGNGFDAIPGSFTPTTDVDTGEFSSAKMTVEVVLAPGNESQLSDLLANLYNPNSPSYRQWLATGEFYSRFAPSAAQIAAVQDHLQAHGLVLEQSSSPFLVRASGPSSVVEAAFGTSLHTYRNPRGITYFSNASDVRVPTSLAAGVRGVVGLSNTVRLRPRVLLPANHKSPTTPGCETPYVTAEQLFNAFNGVSGFPYGYGDGPGCNGLTPSQTNSIYDAPNVGPSGRGAGVTLAVFELSAYTQSDITTWAQTFYGRHYTPPLENINVDDGPLSTFCPPGDTCYPGYGGDIEVNADIEMQLTIAPDARHLLVYNAPNDALGLTELDEYTKIANDNRADSVSSSWGECERDIGAAIAQAENEVFEQMAAQGQSMFSSAGDTGGFDCIRDGTPNPDAINVGDPSSQPWVTSVGGTSLESFNPGVNPNPHYPQGVETVWNVDDLCNDSLTNEGGVSGGASGYPLTGYFWCAAAGAGGGGNSQFWGRPFYQFGPGITNPNTTYGNGTTQCSLAPLGKPCREVPDISANADEYTPYAEYCTGTDPTSTCAIVDTEFTPVGWFGIGGTSLSSPLWSAIIADRDSFSHGRVGNANPLLYLLYNSDYHGYFHDITGIGQSTNNNGLFPTTPGYDLATGIGSPKMDALITGVPDR
jgi:subtilase family serine protease